MRRVSLEFFVRSAINRGRPPQYEEVEAVTNVTAAARDPPRCGARLRGCI
jgi:hypothetical protein